MESMEEEDDGDVDELHDEMTKADISRIKRNV